MILYYYTTLNLVAMWYYGENMECRIWCFDLNNSEEVDHESEHPTIESRRKAKHLEEEGWCEVLYDTGDE